MEQLDDAKLTKLALDLSEAPEVPCFQDHVPHGDVDRLSEVESTDPDRAFLQLDSHREGQSQYTDYERDEDDFNSPSLSDKLRERSVGEQPDEDPHQSLINLQTIDD